MNVLLKTLMISCKESTLLTERKLSDGLGGWDRIKLALHQRLCAYCKNYEDQSRLIDEALQSEHAPVIFKIDAATKEQIQGKINTWLK
jgi:hypothetical protein